MLAYSAEIAIKRLLYIIIDNLQYFCSILTVKLPYFYSTFAVFLPHTYRTGQGTCPEWESSGCGEGAGLPLREPLAQLTSVGNLLCDRECCGAGERVGFWMEKSMIAKLKSSGHKKCSNQVHFFRIFWIGRLIRR